MRNCCVAALIFVAQLCSAQTLGPDVQPFVKVNAPVVALTHVRVIDGTGAAARDDQTIVVRQGKIESVGTAGVPKEAQIIDLTGHTIIPGLVGMQQSSFLHGIAQAR
jgi:predicted amidohydrolase